jgi:hypothetical protein
MLHSIDSLGNISWHCHTPNCLFHSCSDWDEGISCLHHEHNSGESKDIHSAHISNQGVSWVGPEEIELPVCTQCGEKMTLKVHNNVAEPIITKDEQTGEILQVRMPEGFEHHGNLWFKDADIVKQAMPHPTLAHLTTDQIRAQQESLRAVAPNAPVDWMMQEMLIEKIHRVIPHPAVARHQELAKQLNAAGKVWIEPTPQSEESVEDKITRILQEHGVITTPNIPAVKP